jgi:hypothetical protein
LKKANCPKGRDAKPRVRKDGRAANTSRSDGQAFAWLFLSEGNEMIGKNGERSIKRSLEIVHEGVNFDLCRRVTLCEAPGGFYRVKMEAFIAPKKKKGEY